MCTFFAYMKRFSEANDVVQKPSPLCQPQQTFTLNVNMPQSYGSLQNQCMCTTILLQHEELEEKQLLQSVSPNLEGKFMHLL